LTTDITKPNQLLFNRIAVKVAFFFNGFVLANWVSRLPRIQEHFGANDGVIGVVLFSLSCGAVAAMPFAGWIIIKFGSRKITLLSLLGYCAFIPLIPIVTNTGSLIFIFVFIGITTGVLDVAMNAQAVMVEKQYGRPIMTSFHALFSIGMAMGAWCGTLFTDLHFTLLNHFLSIMALSVVAIIWVSRNLIFDKPEKPQASNGPLLRIPNAALLSVGLIAFCCMVGEGAMSDWTVNYMENVAHANKTFAPIGLSAFATAMTLGRLLGDRVRARFGDSKLIIGGGIIACAGLLFALLIATPFASLAGFFLVGIGLSTIVPIAYSIAGHSKDLPPGVGIAMVTTVGYSGFLLGPPAIGFISYLYDLRVGLAIVLILLIVMTVLGGFRRSTN
jgi:MFS family permease